MEKYMKWYFFHFFPLFFLLYTDYVFVILYFSQYCTIELYQCRSGYFVELKNYLQRSI
jgi:hypothetical protein